MDITYRLDKDILYIAIEGRVDASNAAAAEEKIFAIKAENPGMHVVIDADNLEYISSAGLRVILKAQKAMAAKGGMIIKNVNETIMEIFEITGFSDILTIE